MKLKLTERQIQAQIIQYLKWKKYKVMRLNSGAIRTYNKHTGRKNMIRLAEVGTPDIMAFKPYLDTKHIGVAEICFIEVKAGTNKPTRMQEIRMQELREYGARVIVAYSVDDVKKEGL